ncbi:hypothetical protein PHISCL_08806 [Aspergillus sclerotialis]|uniref:RING-type domain-containing protein n=1 Tax=Aspergillus sclerotialis TaxID=2070753 RepID=A0A3A2Z889_9EURO|nr:hypothetical protein PHISCL_08806 [Aspergillus sclerotialis]
MDFCLRCNSLKCRSQLKEQAVVTTCSHIFCLQCAGKLGLSHTKTGERRCPACQSSLVNPDDAVSTVLNPTEDYKTSVLSGLDPNTIMECAGRALVFWAYQTTQEVFYQEFLGKTLTEKYTALSNQMDKVIHNANSEISTLQSRLSEMQKTQDQLHKKNQELIHLYRDKCKSFTQITNLYNLLKSRAMRSQMQSAATDSVSRTLNSIVSRPEVSTSASNKPTDMPPSLQAPHQAPQTLRQHNMSTDTPHPQISQSPRRQNMYPIQDGVEQLHRYQRSGTGSSKGAKRKPDTRVMPPPPSRTGMNVRNVEPNAAPHRTRLLPPSRPSTSLSQLPTEHAMFDRFWGAPVTEPGYSGMFVNVDTGPRGQENTAPGSGQPIGQVDNAGSRLRAPLFDNSTI